MSKVTERPSNGLMIINRNEPLITWAFSLLSLSSCVNKTGEKSIDVSAHVAQTVGNTANHHTFTFGNQAFVSSSQKMMAGK